MKQLRDLFKKTMQNNRKRPISELWPVILATLLIWLSAAGLFANYVEEFADYGATFAGLAGVMTALIFLYLMAVSLILGGELNATIRKRRRVQSVNECSA